MLQKRWSAYLDRQHRLPSGLVGQLIGERMLRQHTPETNWSIGLLDLQPADRVLELGFGAGRALRLMLRRIPHGHALGLDRSPTMLRAAAWRNRGALARQQLALINGTIEQLPLRSTNFDKILTIHTFYFWPDALAISQQLVELLNPGGRLVCTFATARTLATGQQEWWPVHQQAVRLVQQLHQRPQISATLAFGPDSRQFNNVAIVVDRVRH